MVFVNRVPAVFGEMGEGDVKKSNAPLTDYLTPGIMEPEVELYFGRRI